MRRVLVPLLLAIAGCGSTSSAGGTEHRKPAGDPVTSGGPIVFVAVSALGGVGRDLDLVPLACAGGVGGVTGGRVCLDAIEGELGAVRFAGGGAAVARLAAAPAPSNPCMDALGAATAGAEVRDHTFIQPLELGVWPAGSTVDLQLIPSTPLAPGKPLELDLDGDGVAEHLTIAGAAVDIVDGRDPLMTDTLAPFPDAASLAIRATTDLDGDRRRELLLVASHPSGGGLAVIEYWGDGEAYRLDCRAP